MFLILDGFARAYPLIIIFHTFLNGVINNNGDELRFSIFLLIADIFNHFIKTFVFRPLFGNKILNKNPTNFDNFVGIMMINRFV